MIWLFLAAFLGFSIATEALMQESDAAELFVPTEATQSFGNQRFDPSATLQFQQVYGSSNFYAAPTVVMRITGVGFRFDESLTNQSSVEISWAQLSIGTTENPGLNMAENIQHSVQAILAQNLRFAISENRSPSDFSIAFQFEQPFLYDRRAGALVLQGTFEGKLPFFEDSAACDFKTGYLLYYSPLFQTQELGVVLATRFLYTPVPVVDSIALGDGFAKVRVQAAGIGALVVEGANSITGPFEVEATVKWVAVSANVSDAILPVSGGKRFWRVKQV